MWLYILLFFVGSFLVLFGLILGSLTQRFKLVDEQINEIMREALQAEQELQGRWKEAGSDPGSGG